MKRKYVSVSMLFLIGGCSFFLHAKDKTPPDPPQDSKVIIEWNNEKQTIDGFGIAQADWADELFLFENREQIMDLLFGKNGLRLNILRGEIFPHYWENRTDKDFDVLANTDITKIRGMLQEIPSHDLLRRGQLWVTLEAHNKYKIDKLVFSAWSPPAWMKTNGEETHGHWVTNGKLKPECYQDFADYLAAFYQAYQSAGVAPYAISPSNEPGYAAPWNSCIWTADEMGQFVNDYLGPTFERKGIASKIMIGENPAWSVNCDMLKMISSLDFTTGLLTKYPDITRFNLITAGHGYIMPDTLPLPAECLQTPIVPFKAAEEKKIPAWVTEISDISRLDTSMQDGLRWAAMFHQYLTDANVNAIVWWCGAMPTTTNESLIILDKDQKKFTLAKRYDTFGNYTRFVPEGSRRVGIQNASPLLVSAFKKDKQYTIVVINPTKEEVRTTLNLSGKNATNLLSGFSTDPTDRWKENKYKIDQNNEVSLLIPKETVISFVGELK